MWLVRLPGLHISSRFVQLLLMIPIVFLVNRSSAGLLRQPYNLFIVVPIMAKFRSHVAAEISGSVGGMTFKSSAGGAGVLSTRFKANMSQSSKQDAYRSILHKLDVLFRALSAEDQQGWQDYFDYWRESNPRKFSSYTTLGFFKSVLIRPFYYNYYGTSTFSELAEPPAVYSTASFTLESFNREIADETQISLYFRNTGNVSLFPLVNKSRPLLPTTAYSVNRYDHFDQPFINVPPGVLQKITFSGFRLDRRYQFRVTAVSTPPPRLFSYDKFFEIPAL